MCVFTIECPDTYMPERNYIIDVILNAFWGINYLLKTGDRKDVRITTGNGKELIIEDILFQFTEPEWLTQNSLPERPLDFWNVKETPFRGCALLDDIPVIYGRACKEGGYGDVSKDSIRLGIDILGSAFFMLTCYEELIKQESDIYGNFPFTSSLAYQEGFLDRPIINEYVEILWKCLKLLWPQVERKKRAFRVLPTHDVDVPIKFSSMGLIFRGIGHYLIKEPDLRLLSRWIYGSFSRLLNPVRDPNFKGLKTLMKFSERHNLQSSFYFMGADPGNEKDNGYDPLQKIIVSLMEEMERRGHKIGFHAGYTTTDNQRLFIGEKEKVEKACGHKIKEGRHHYLRFKMPGTARIWEKAGMEFDSSLGYAMHNGFRCGVCYPYPLFDIEERRRLNIQERPLIVMDSTLASPVEGEGLSPAQAYTRVMELAKACYKFSGDFVLLWHNGALDGEWYEWRQLYESILRDLSEIQNHHQNYLWN